MDHLFTPITFPCGQVMKNRFMLAPLTNTQSHENGTLSDDEYHWLTMRARGGFGLTMTCASHVQAKGKGFSGQLGIFSNVHIQGHTRLTKAIRDSGSLAVVQLHHAGIRSPKELIGEDPVGPSEHANSGSRSLSIEEVQALRNDFIAAAIRAQKSGYNGVEIHGAHGYIICQFLSSAYNFRQDDYGGSLENRSRLLFEIIDGVRASCGREFLLGVRLSPERFGMHMQEIITLIGLLIKDGKIDFLDLSLWDVFKEPEEEAFKGKSLLDHFAAIDYGNIQWTVAGQIRSASSARTVIDAGADFVTIGTAAIIHHDFPKKVRMDSSFTSVSLPVTTPYLKGEGVGDNFVEYLRKRPGFVT